MEVKMEWKPTWVYPKVVGFNPPERWGHSACYSQGRIYIFGGCRGGLHFGDVLVLDLESMVWTSLATTGEGPGPRDSHSAVLFGNNMVVFGGSDGSMKVNVVHVLNLRMREWTKPDVEGKFPAPRESHTATMIGHKMVVFGGSGDGVGNYLNDVHVLDLKQMRWTSPEVTGEVPVPRDSHSAVAIDNSLFVYGGDCGDRYHGDVDVLDTSTMSWSKLAVREPQPRVRAGHGAVAIGNKMYTVGGIGDRHYYNDVWVLDEATVSWSQLNSLGEQPRGRFSHTALAIGNNIAIYGGCDEDERPLNELLILKLEQEYLCNRKIRRRPRGYSIVNDGGTALKDALPRAVNVSITEASEPFGFSFKQGTITKSSIVDVELDTEEHSLSRSQNSSPSLSDQDQKTSLTKSADHPVIGFRHFKCSDVTRRGSPVHLQSSSAINASKRLKSKLLKRPTKFCVGEPQIFARQEQPGLPAFHSVRPSQEMIGAEVRGKVDGEFDSGFLVTASIKGKIFRGVLFAPGQCVDSRDACQRIQSRRELGTVCGVPNSVHVASRPRQITSAGAAVSSFVKDDPKHKSDLQGVVLTLGGPGNGQS